MNDPYGHVFTDESGPAYQAAADALMDDLADERSQYIGQALANGLALLASQYRDEFEKGALQVCGSLAMACRHLAARYAASRAPARGPELLGAITSGSLPAVAIPIEDIDVLSSSVGSRLVLRDMLCCSGCAAVLDKASVMQSTRNEADTATACTPGLASAASRWVAAGWEGWRVKARQLRDIDDEDNIDILRWHTCSLCLHRFIPSEQGAGRASAVAPVEAGGDGYWRGLSRVSRGWDEVVTYILVDSRLVAGGPLEHEPRYPGAH